MSRILIGLLAVVWMVTPLRAQDNYLQMLEEKLRAFHRRDYKTLTELQQGFDTILTPFTQKIPSLDSFWKHGMVQEFYLAYLTKAVRGREFVSGHLVGEGGDGDGELPPRVFGWDLISASSVMDQQWPRGAVDFLRAVLPASPLDAQGLFLFKRFLLAYKGVEQADGLRQIIQLVEAKQPVGFAYSHYKYQSVLTEGQPNFQYTEFSYESESQPPPAVTTESLERDTQQFIDKLESTTLLEGTLTQFNLISTELLEGVPGDHSLSRQGIIQEAYLALLAKIVRGGAGGWAVHYNTGQRFVFASKEFMQKALNADMDSQIVKRVEVELLWNLQKSTLGSRGGKDYFLQLLERAPLDSRGLELLRGFLTAYEGVEDRESFSEMIDAVKAKQPVGFRYRDFDYKVVFQEGSPTFAYDRFRYDSAKQEVVSAASLMDERVAHFAQRMQERVKGSVAQIQRTAELVKENRINPEKKITITLLGTSGNGKTEFFRAMALALYGTEKAMGKLTLSGGSWELNNFFRPPAGTVGYEPTDFEKWLVGRIEKKQGGIIVLDELLSFRNLSIHARGEKIQAINRLYELLDERKLQIGSRSYDVSQFHVGITGNLMQEDFLGLDDNPDVEKIVEKLLKKVNRRDYIVSFMEREGFDAAKVARFGEIFVNGPLKRKTTQQVGKRLLQDNLKQVLAKRSVEIDVDPKIIDGIVQRLTTIQLGMREVNMGISQVVMGPINGTLFDLPKVQKIEGRLVQDQIHWYADGKEVVLTGEVIDSASGLENRVWRFKSDLEQAGGKWQARTPGFSDLNLPRKLRLTEEELHIVVVHELEGHWQVGTLLEGKNKAESVSMIPSSQYGGYVLYDLDIMDESKIEHVTLSTLLKDSVRLEAGHRAPILRGLYSTGGGDDGVAMEEEITDLSKVRRKKRIMMRNHLLQGFTEYSRGEGRVAFKEVIGDVGKGVADELITFGNSRGLVDELREKALQERYLDKEFLNSYAKQMVEQVGRDHDVLFIESLGRVAGRLLSEYTESGQERKAEMLRTLVDSTLQDVRALRQIQMAGKTKVLGQIERKSQAVRKVLWREAVSEALAQEVALAKNRTPEQIRRTLVKKNPRLKGLVTLQQVREAMATGAGERSSAVVAACQRALTRLKWTR